MNRGFIHPEIQKEDWIFGGRETVINSERDWTDFLPKGEIQRRKFETSSCTEFGWLNAIETLEKKKYGIDSNYSERFVSIGAENTPQGNDPHKVAEWIRKNKLIDESYLGFNDSIKDWDEYMTPSSLPRKLTNLAKKWPYLFTHTWIAEKGTALKERLERMWDALLYSPIPVSVDAWTKKGDLYVKEEGAPDNHWCVAVGVVKNSKWLVFDSYDDDNMFIKPLDWNYDFQFAKSFKLQCFVSQTDKLQSQTETSCLTALWQQFKR